MRIISDNELNSISGGVYYVSSQDCIDYNTFKDTAHDAHHDAVLSGIFMGGIGALAGYLMASHYTATKGAATAIAAASAMAVYPWAYMMSYFNYEGWPYGLFR